MKHNKSFCNKCLWPKDGIGCEVFNDRSDPIFDKNGLCNARITDEREMEKLRIKMEKYETFQGLK